MITPLTETQALTEDALVREAQRGESCRTWLLRRARAAVVRRHRRGRRSAWSRRVVRLAASSAFMLLLLPVAGLVYYVYFDRSGLPDLERFIRFEPPTIGTVYDARNKVLIELAREYRRVISYDEVPVILRQAILAAEDKNFFSHSGVEYRALPRVVHKMAAHYLVAWWNAEPGLRLRFPQGGSTLTQQLVRGYFLQDRTSQEDGNALFREGLTQRLFAAGLGVPATNKLFRKLKEVRLALWLEEEMRRRYRSQEQAKREIFVRYANFLYLGNSQMARRSVFVSANGSCFSKVIEGVIDLVRVLDQSFMQFLERPRRMIPGIDALGHLAASRRLRITLQVIKELLVGGAKNALAGGAESGLRRWPRLFCYFASRQQRLQINTLELLAAVEHKNLGHASMPANTLS
jgi:Transglycosylase